ncbi:hypothetical protein BJ508DRAFT_316319, partial [Ascobolus immersus RN42]
AFDKQNRSKTAPEWAPVVGNDCGKTWGRYFCFDVVAKLESYYQRLLFLAAQRNMEYRELRGRARGLKEAEAILAAIHSKHPAMQTLVTNFNDEALKLPTKLRPPTLQLDAFKGVDPWDEEIIVSETGESTAESSRDALFALHLSRTEIIDPDCVPTSPWARSNAVRMGILFQLKVDRSQEELVLLKKEWDRNVLHTEKVIGILLNALAPGENSVCVVFRPSYVRMLWDELLRAKLLIWSHAKANTLISTSGKKGPHYDVIDMSHFSCGSLPDLLAKGRSVCDQHRLHISSRGSPSPRNAVSVSYSAPAELSSSEIPSIASGTKGSEAYINGLLTEGFAGLQMEALHSEGGDGGIFADFADTFSHNEGAGDEDTAEVEGHDDSEGASDEGYDEETESEDGSDSDGGNEGHDAMTE